MDLKLNSVADIYRDAESGNVAAVISALSGVDIAVIENRLSHGIFPKELAKELGVEEDFCNIVMHRVSSQLIKAVKTKNISLKIAQKLASAFEEGFLNEQSKN